jgi:hypothetical protein
MCGVRVASSVYVMDGHRLICVLLFAVCHLNDVFVGLLRYVFRVIRIKDSEKQTVRLRGILIPDRPDGGYQNG